MASEKVTIEWERTPDYKVIQPNSVTVTVVDQGLGPSAVMHFTVNTILVTGETFDAEVEPQTGSVVQVGPPTFRQTGIKQLLATVHLRAIDAGGLIRLLLPLFPAFPDTTKEELRKAIAQHVK